MALDVAAFVEAAGIGAHVLGALEAGGVLEIHVRDISWRHLQRRVHVAERGGEDQLVAGARELLDRALGVGAFADVLEIGGLDLVAERLRQGLAADFMLVGPAEIADRAEIDEADFELVGGRSAPNVAAASAATAAAAAKQYSISHAAHSGLSGRTSTVPDVACRPSQRASVEAKSQRSGTNTSAKRRGRGRPGRVRASAKSARER